MPGGLRLLGYPADGRFDRAAHAGLRAALGGRLPGMSVGLDACRLALVTGAIDERTRLDLAAVGVDVVNAWTPAGVVGPATVGRAPGGPEGGLGRPLPGRSVWCPEPDPAGHGELVVTGAGLKGGSGQGSSWPGRHRARLARRPRQRAPRTRPRAPADRTREPRHRPRHPGPRPGPDPLRRRRHRGVHCHAGRGRRGAEPGAVLAVAVMVSLALFLVGMVTFAWGLLAWPRVAAATTWSRCRGSTSSRAALPTPSTCGCSATSPCRWS